MKAYVAIEYTDANGKHEPGEQVTFDPSEREGVETLINYGILSRTEPKSDDEAEA